MIGAGYSMAESWDMDRVFGMFNMYQAGHADNSYSNKINTPSTTVSFLGRGNYSLKGRYLLTATLRADGSSKSVSYTHLISYLCILFHPCHCISGFHLPYPK